MINYFLKLKQIVRLAVFFIALFNAPFIKAQSNQRTESSITKQFNWVMKEVRNAKSKNVLVVAHRGDWRNTPENSIQALKNCIQMGIDIVEIDLKMTKDSVLVLMHDKIIDRTMSGKGNPGEYTLDSLKKMTLKSAHGCPTTHRIPTFEEYMLEAKGKMFINVDKCYPYIKEVIAVLKKTGTIDQVFLNGEKDYNTNRNDYGELLDKVIYKPVVNLDKPTASEYINEYEKKLQPKVIELVFAKDISPFLNDDIKLFQTHNTKIWYNALWAELSGGHCDDVAVEQHNTKDSWDWLIQHGATIIQSDRPLQLLQYLTRKGMHPKF